MKLLTINNRTMKSIKYIIILLVTGFFNLSAFAQEKEANMSISFVKEEGKNICKVLVTSEDKPVAEIAVKLSVKRLFGQLPIGGDVSTDETGVASFEFPDNLPLNPEGKLEVTAAVEDDENYGSFDVTTETQIGTKVDLSNLEKRERSLSGGRDRAPIYFIIASVVIISGIWGTLIYVVLQVFKLKKLKTT
jgi:hypothetical protein